MHWRNNIVIDGHKAFLSTSGSDWGIADDLDGVWCIDLETGRKIWFQRTRSDANEISLINNVVLVGTDGGAIFALSATDGNILDEIDVGAPTYVRAIKSENAANAIGMLTTKTGKIVRYDFTNNKFSIIGEIPYSIRSNPVAIGRDEFLVGAEEGAVLKISLGENASSVRYENIFQAPVHRASGSYDFSLEVIGISSLVVVGGRVIVSYVRDTNDRRPPISCFSLSTGEKLWDASRISSVSKSENQEFGNSRITPVIWDKYLLSTFSYNEGLHAFSLETGKWSWRLRLDDSYFQNWASPVLQGDKLFVARVNGVLSIIDLNARDILASYSVEIVDGSADEEEFTKQGNDVGAWPNSKNAVNETGPYPGQPLVAGICATPAINDDKILVGTVSGKLHCLRRSTHL